VHLPGRLQDLAPRLVRFVLKAERFLVERAPVPLTGGRWCVGFSGGLDSTALLAFAALLAPRHGALVLAAHFDHRLRPESGQDAAHCAAVCRELGIPLVTASGDVAAFAAARGLGLEEAGRELRYDFFRKVLAEPGACLLLLAHHAGDLAEDQLLRLVRGTGWPELGGMAAARADLPVVRPFLLTPRRAIEGFVTGLALPWREDASNLARDRRRNRLRHEVLPLLQKENPSLAATSARLWRLADIDRDYFDQQLSAFPLTEPGPDGCFELHRALLAGLHPALRLRLYKAVMARLGPGQVRVETLLGLDAALSSGAEGKVFQLPGGKSALLGKRTVIFRPAGYSGIDSRQHER